MMSFWTHKLKKKKIRAESSATGRRKKKKKKKEKKKEKERCVPGRTVGGDSGERLARLNGTFLKGHRAAPSLGSPFTTMDQVLMIKII